MDPVRSYYPEQRRTIAVDVSNLTGGLTPGYTFNVKELMWMLRGGRQPASICESRAAGYHTHLEQAPDWESAGVQWMHKLNQQGKVQEHLVDAALTAFVFRSLLDDDRRKGDSTLVLASGDGNDNHDDPSFIESVLLSLKKGCRVEVWTWRGSCSLRYRWLERCVARFARTSGLKESIFTVHELDKYRDKLEIARGF